jgi:ubiquinone/menaquinone biosynthesis C-methylase UbiE
VEDITHLPFKDAVFDTVTFIANMNHIPEPSRDAELSEAYRCLKQSGNIVVTFGNPLAEIIIFTMLFRREDLKRTNWCTEANVTYYLLDSPPAITHPYVPFKKKPNSCT